MCYAQAVQPAPAAVHIGAYAKTATNALQAGANQAALGNVKSFAATVYGEKRFLLRAFSTYQVALVQPAGAGAFGMQLVYAGDADFSTSKLGFAYGRRLSKTLDVGVQFDYLNNRIRGYGSAAQVSIEGGMICHFSEAVHAGFQVCNPVGVTLPKYGQKTPAVYTAGVSYHPSEQVAITTELIKTTRLPLAVQSGLQYSFLPTLWAKAGINSGAASFFIDAGVQLTYFSVELIGSVHPQLGLSPALMLIYNSMGK